MSALFALNEDWAEISVLLVSIFDRFPQAHAIAFLLAIISRLGTDAAAANIPTSAIAELRRGLSLRVFDDESKLSRIITPLKIKWTSDYGRLVSPPSWQTYYFHENRNQTSASETGLVVTSYDLVNFARGLNNLSINTENLLELFIQKIIAQCDTFSVGDMHQLWMPFLYQLITDLVYQSVSLDNQTYRELTRRLIKHCHYQTAGPQPEVVDVPTPEVNCTCTDCMEMNEFLRDPRRGVGRFFKHSRRHFEQQLATAGIPCGQALQSGAFVVTKHHTLQLDLDAWKKRQKEFYHELTSKIKQEHLQCLLCVEEAARIRSIVGPVEEAGPWYRYSTPPRRTAQLAHSFDEYY